MGRQRGEPCPGAPPRGPSPDAPAALRFLSVEPLLESLGPLDLSGIHWVIVGGESGHGARPLQESWVLEIRDRCREAGVPFFFKQWGGRQKKRTGRELGGRTYDEIPERAPEAVADPESLRRALAEFEAYGQPAV